MVDTELVLNGNKDVGARESGVDAYTKHFSVPTCSIGVHGIIRGHVTTTCWVVSVCVTLTCLRGRRRRLPTCYTIEVRTTGSLSSRPVRVYFTI